MSLTLMQKRYVWLAGSFPDRVVEQGRGKRTKELLYALHEDRLVLFGYSFPLYFMENKLFRKLQGSRVWTLTEAGEKEFQKLLIGQFGLNAGVREVQVAPREDPR